MMTTLKQARETGNLNQFIKEHRKDGKGDKLAVAKTLRSMTGKSKATRQASKRGGDAG